MRKKLEWPVILQKLRLHSWMESMFALRCAPRKNLLFSNNWMVGKTYIGKYAYLTSQQSSNIFQSFTNNMKKRMMFENIFISWTLLFCCFFLHSFVSSFIIIILWLYSIRIKPYFSQTICPPANGKNYVFWSDHSDDPRRVRCLVKSFVWRVKITKHIRIFWFAFLLVLARLQPHDNNK